MKQSLPAARGLLRVALTLQVSAACSRSASTFPDIPRWTGTGPNEAAMVIDFGDGAPSLVYGYRWPAGETRTGQDMLAAIIGVNPALSVDSTFFPGTFTLDTRSRSYSDNGTADNYFDDLYWGYWVNNDVFYHPSDFTLNSHVIPPATAVVPLGNPGTAGTWVESSTGAAARPLANGSWDGWAFGVYGTRPLLPAATIPEPSAPALLIMAAAAGSRRRSSTARRA